MMQGTGTFKGWAVREVVSDRKLRLARGGAGRLRKGFAPSVGIGILYLGGVAQLLFLTGQDPVAVLAVGVLPFLFGDLIKVLLAVLLLEGLQSTSLGRF